MTQDIPSATFRDPESIGVLIRADLMEMIDRYLPVDQIPTPLELERRAYEAFASTRRRAYIANPDYLKKINTWLGGTHHAVHAKTQDAEHSHQPTPDFQPLVISAPSGMGKSSHAAYLAQQYRPRKLNEFFIELYIG